MAALLKIDFKNIPCYKLFLLILILALICLGYYFLYNDIKNHSSGGDTHKICSVENKNDMMHTYLLPYLVFILTFIGSSSLEYGQLVALIIFFAILFVVYVRSDLFLFDFMLIVFGYSYYKVTSQTNAFVVISNVNLYEKINQEVYFRLIDDNLFKYGEYYDRIKKHDSHNE
jgi:uncharacterized membrane protein